jgi:1-acyl-sn-glycerol-3-phosphate acyltransferase
MSWMFKRVTIPKKFKMEKEIYKRSNKNYYTLNSYLSRLAKITHFLSWGKMGVKIINGIFKLFFKIFNRLSITGKENIPKTGAIFYCNHPGSYDVTLLILAVGKPVGCFISWDNFWITDLGEIFLTFINKQKIQNSIQRKQSSQLKTRDILIELMIQNILKKNSYFSIWPEGGLSHERMVRQGFSSFVRAYAVVNAKKDRIPFVPVHFEGSECYHVGINPKMSPRTRKIKIRFLKPTFIPREWLNNPSDDPNGKTPREISDYLMKILARANGQKTFTKNQALENSRKRYIQSKNLKN